MKIALQWLEYTDLTVIRQYALGMHGANSNISRELTIVLSCITIYSIYDVFWFVKSFKKYFIKDIGEKVSYVRTVETPGIKVVGESVENVIEERQVNKVNYQSEYNGNIAPDGYEYIIVNITVYNDGAYKRIVNLSDMSLEYNIDWSTSSYLSDENYGEMIHREYDENMLFYTSKIISERKKRIENIVTDEDTGEIYIDAGTSVTYNAVWLIKKEHEQSLVIKKLYNKKQRYNTDYIIKIS